MKTKAQRNTTINKAWKERCKLCAEGDLIFINAVIKVHGKDAVINWKGDAAEVNGVVYK